MAALGPLRAQNLVHVRDNRQKSSLAASVHRVGLQVGCLRSVESQQSGLVCRRAQFDCTDFRSVDMDMSAVGVDVADAAAAVDVAVGAGAVVAAVAVAVAIVAGPALDDLRDYRLDRTASTFFVVSCPKTSQSDLTSFALSE